MSKKPAVEAVDHSADLLMTLAHAVERMSRVGPGKEFNAEIVKKIAAVEEAHASDAK